MRFNRGVKIVETSYKKILYGISTKIISAISCFLQEIKQNVCNKINYWQSLKWQNSFDEIDNKIVNFSAKDDVFKLARFTLHYDYDAFDLFF